MFNVRLAGGHLYGKQLFTWLSLVVSLMASFVLSFFPLDVLDEIWDLIESVSEGFLTYSFNILVLGLQNNSAKQPCLSLSDHGTAVLQQIGIVLPMFYDVISLSTLTSSCCV